MRNRRVVCEVQYCDFKSMYPSVNILMGLWEFVTAQGMTVHDTTKETRALLEQITLEDLQQRATWRKFRTLVRVTPEEDVLPVRAEYGGETHTIGLNRLTTSQPLWYTLADCIASKLLTGRCPHIEKALTYGPGPPQDGLAPIKILGRDDFTIDPRKDDFFKRLVDLRDEAKGRGDSAEKALKTIANSTSYGIFIEVNRDDAPKVKPLNIFGSEWRKAGDHHQGNRRSGSLLQSPSRRAHHCDTDSLAIIRPKGMTRQEFHKRARRVIDWFIPLNPYRKPGSILKLEDLNHGIGSAKMEPLYCYAISAKRYVLFNLTTGNRPVLRKA